MSFGKDHYYDGGHSWLKPKDWQRVMDSDAEIRNLLMSLLEFINEGADVGQVTVEILKIFIRRGIPIPLFGNKDPVLNALSALRLNGNEKERRIAGERLRTEGKEDE